MSDDLVKRLRAEGIAELDEAADRIEKLEAALREIATRCDAHRLPVCDRNGQWAADTARKALEGKNGT